MNVAFVVRLIWENQSQNWRIQLTPANGDDPRLFCDAESLFVYIEQVMERSERELQDVSPRRDMGGDGTRSRR